MGMFVEIKYSNTRTKRSGVYLQLCLGFLCLFTSTFVFAYETGQNSLNDYFRIQLSNQVKEAVDNGIVLNFDCELSNHTQWSFLKFPKNKKRHQFNLTHHSLSNRYLVRFNDVQAPKNFKSASEATAFITEKSIDFFRQYANKHNDAQMRLSLNKYKLLGPIRLNAFISEPWNIDTGWISWSPDI